MEEEKGSSNMMKTEASDSDSSSYLVQRASTNSRPSRQSSGSSQYKGVVFQQNGHWGAQIYAKQRRIWLGTFKTEEAAAMAYDSAAIKLRHGDSSETHRNFPVNERTRHEPGFQANYSTDEVLDMIKDGSYQTKFNEYVASISQNPSGNQNNNPNMQEGHYRQELFRKELTPSDVGKLNRLVIPKRHALNYFSANNNVGKKVDGCEGEQGEDQGEDMELTFYDNRMKQWSFRYCYWQSSQSYVFTRGWNKFVQDKNLEANDIVIFYMCGLRDNDGRVLNKYWMIDTVKNNDRGESNSGRGETNNDDGGESPSNDSHDSKMDEGETSGIKKEKGIKLFGVRVVPNCNGEI